MAFGMEWGPRICDRSELKSHLSQALISYIVIRGTYINDLALKKTPQFIIHNKRGS
jgi:hypothetical protein